MPPGRCPSATAGDRGQSGRVITNAHNTSSTPVAIVTGGSRSIGGAVARKLAIRDYAVVINYLNSQPAADAAVEEILAANGTAVTVRADVADERDVERLFEETIHAFGGVDVVVHAAARMTLGTVAGYDLETFDALHRVNARGTFVVNQQASLQLRDGGAIVNFSSSAVGLALPSYAAYAASKGAVDAITPVLARELSARDITVNAIALGLERPATPAGIANLVAFLVSDDGHWVNGQVIRANGCPKNPGPPTRGFNGCEPRREAPR
jgi:3-oxoacyl-[acyl-carrier protein] reductase